MTKRQLETWLAVTLSLAILGMAAFLADGYLLRREAQRLLDDVSTFTSAPNHDAAFAVLRQKYGHRVTPVDGCSADDCSYEITVSNRLLSKLFRLRYTELNVRFDVVRKSIVVVMVDYRAAQSNRDSPVVHIQTDFCPAYARCGNFDIAYVHPWAQSSPERWSGIVEMGFSTLPELRKAALSLDLNCLTRMRGCTDIAQLLPAVWRPSATGVRCIVANREGRAR
jgi:hypothetical protein